MNDRPSVLLVEDDPVLAEALRQSLQREGFAPQVLADGIEAYKALQVHAHAALVLDIGLPGLGGLDLLHRLRAGNPDLPVIVVSAYGTVQDRVRGLELGADDYLPKPFELDELVARLRALLRRGARDLPPLRVRDVELDPRSHRVRVAGQPVWLTSREFAVLKLLMEHPGEAVAREAIEAHLYGFGEEVETNAVDVFVYALRRKLGRDLIRTYRGSGYAITP